MHGLTVDHVPYTSAYATQQATMPLSEAFSSRTIWFTCSISTRANTSARVNLHRNPSRCSTSVSERPFNSLTQVPASPTLFFTTTRAPAHLGAPHTQIFLSPLTPASTDIPSVFFFNLFFVDSYSLLQPCCTTVAPVFFPSNLLGCVHVPPC